MRGSRVLIHLDNLESNIRKIRELAGAGIKLCLAVKANGYGHGAVEISRAAVDMGVDYLGIASAAEGYELRKAGITSPLLLLSLTPPEDIPRVVECAMSAVVASQECISRFEEVASFVGKTAVLHIKVDTGMGRIGCTPEEARNLAIGIVKSPVLALEGVCTHFPVADIEDSTFTSNQIDLFNKVISEIRMEGIDPGIVHASNSAGLIRYNTAKYDMVRIGIAAYGYPQGPNPREIPGFKPVMEMRSKLVFLKKVAAGTPLSYGLTYTTERDTTIGTVTAGYGDGYPRLLSNNADVVIRGRRYPVVGRVCMDQLLVDLGCDPDVRLYDDVVLFGPGPGTPDAAELADAAGTIAYEITCGVSGRVSRAYQRGAGTS